MMQLKDPGLFREAALVAGRWIEARGQTRTSVCDPAKGNIIGHVPVLGEAETHEAIAAAASAQKEWAANTARDRAEILKAWYALILAHRDDLAMILTREQGKPLHEAASEIIYGASFIEWFAEEARRLYGETIPAHQRDKRILTVRQPAGVVAAITPWNFPNAMITRKVAPALAAGCAVVLKPAPQTP